MDEDQVLVSALEAFDRFLAAVRGAVVDDHEHASGFAVRLDGHELLDELVERDDPVLGGAAIKQLGAARVSGGEVTQSAASLVLVLDALPALDALRGREPGVLARSRLDRGLLIATDDLIASSESQRQTVTPEICSVDPASDRLARELPG